MIELLIYDKAYRRLRDEIDGLVQPLVMDDEGTVRRGIEVLEAQDVKPEIAWANRDVYTNGPTRDFMVACLKAPALKWLQSSAAGFEHPVFKSLVDNGVRLTNANVSAISIAEFVLARVLEAMHPNAERHQLQREQVWRTTEFREMSATSWLVVGMGSIGQEIGVRARAFGAHVTGVRRNVAGDEPADKMIAPAALLDHVPQADVIVLATALNPSTENLVDDAFLALCSPETILVNIGRGGLVDEAALLRSLDAGRPALAILDVFANEPLPAGDPMWTNPRVWVTAHCAGASEGTSTRGDQFFLDNLKRYVAGDALLKEVHELADR
ncbi:MAG: D-2-hydroxyacid dehydrogenase [Gammaproteobacteria bacterium]|nr:D-2-hydroxyacid dehydrogenase [Gammaproteobacteria bacterium]